MNKYVNKNKKGKNYILIYYSKLKILLKISVMSMFIKV